MKPLHILLAGISPDGVISMPYASNMLSLQTELSRKPDIRASFDIFKSLADAIEKTMKTPDVDMLVAVDTLHSVETGFSLTRDESKLFVVGVYPQQKLDWDRVKKRIADTHEEPHLVPIQYNIDLSNVTCDGGCKYVTLPKDANPELHVVKIHRNALEAIAKSHPEFWKCPTSMSKLCSLYDGPIHADIMNKATTQATVVYGPGCVAMRSQLR